MPEVDLDGAKLVALCRVKNLQEHVSEALTHTTTEIYDLGELDYHYAQAMANIMRAKGLLEVLQYDITNKYNVLQEDV